MTKATVKSNVSSGLRIRDIQDPSVILGHLHYNTLLRRGDSVYGEVKIDNRIYFSKVYRANGTVENIAGSSVVREGTTEWMTLSDEQEPNPNPGPVPEPDVKPLRVTIGGDDYETVTVELKPK